MSALLAKQQLSAPAALARGSRTCAAPRPSVSAPRPSVAVAAARPTWYPGAVAPSHLDGSVPGDYGFDPLRLGTNKNNLRWFREAELMNGRWAMAAVAGILFTDLVGLPKWWEAGSLEYPIDNQTLVIIELALFSFLEAKRYDGFKKTGATGFAFFFPFDPMGMRSAETELKELKNGRLAMLAFLGFASVAAVRGQGPIEALTTHIADPGHNNIFTSTVGKESAIFVALLSVFPMIVEATKALNKGQESIPLFPWNEDWSKVAEK